MGTEIRDARAYGIAKLIIEGSALVLLCFGSWSAWQNLLVLEEQLQDTRVARQLEQRPWVAYSDYQWEVEENNEWTPTDRLRAGERFRVRLSVSNTGGTPAVNVRYTDLGDGKVIDPPPATPEWTLPPVGEVPEGELPPGSFVMPGAESSPSHVVGDFAGLTGQDFDAFRRGEKVLFFRARIEYCDIQGRFHWTEVAIRRYYGELATRFEVDSQRVDPAAGTANDDPRCEVPD